MIYYEKSWDLLPQYCADQGIITDDIQICIVTDTNTADLFSRELISLWKGKCRSLILHEIHPGEKFKTLDSVQEIYHVLIKNGFDRNDLLITLGGGITGDITGFAAATYMRGIRYLQLPTTLLSQVDASIGGKTAVNYEGYKNLIGAFHDPVLTYINLTTLESLPNEEFSEGMAEIIKHAMLDQESSLKWLEDHAEIQEDRDPEQIMQMLLQSSRVKEEIVSEDPRSAGRRLVLNFGHTIGHAIEAASDNRIHHGQAVALGMEAACRISLARGYITGDVLERLIDLLKTYHLPVQISEISLESILNAMKMDKKRKSGKLRFVLLKGIGIPYLCNDITDEELEASMREIIG